MTNTLPKPIRHRNAGNPEAKRKEFDENAAVEVVPGTDRMLTAKEKGRGIADSSDAELDVSTE